MRLLQCHDENKRIYITGIGKSGIVARRMASTLSSISIPSQVSHHQQSRSLRRTWKSRLEYLDCISGCTPASGRMGSLGICNKAMWCVAIALSIRVLGARSDQILCLRSSFYRTAGRQRSWWHCQTGFSAEAAVCCLSLALMTRHSASRATWCVPMRTVVA